MKKIPIFLLFICFTMAAVAQTTHVMTYNIRFATESDGVNAWSKRKTKVFELLRKHNPDILGLQEALHEQIEDIIKANPGYAYVGVGRDDGKRAGEYSPILYKKKAFKLLQQGTFWLSETPEVPGSKSWDAAITRVATFAKMKDKKSGKIFIIINTHFDHIGELARKNSALLLKDKAAALAGGLPVIITGDFNCTRDDAPYAVMTTKGSLDLIDPAPANPPGTYCTFEVNSIECRAIDYIFHTPGFSSRDYVVVTENDGKHYPSDHLPVKAVLSFKK